jgi:hypothetical protein
MEIIFQNSYWYVGLCLLVGAGYAFLMYQPKPLWSRAMNWGLSFLRGALVSIIAFLLLNPLIKTVETIIDKPKAVIAIDNSESVAGFGQKLLPEIKKLQESLSDEGLEVSVQTLDNQNFEDKLANTKFNQKRTNLAGLIGNIKNNFESQNLTDVILLTDGISNEGLSPIDGNYTFRVHSVGVGDTIPKKDVRVRSVVANKIAYLGNQFPIQTDVIANGFAGKTVNVVLKQNGQTVGKKTIIFKQISDFQQVTFQTSSNVGGVQHFVVEVDALAGEFTTKNNHRDTYIDIIDGKEKILLLALAPHPDIKAIRSIVERNANYELDVKIMGLNPSLSLFSDQKYDLIILHQLPDYFNTGGEIVKKYLQKDNTPIFFILGNQSSATAVSTLNTAVAINANAGQIDKVTGRFNPNFKLLNLDVDKLNIIEKLPPLTVPFGTYKLLAGSEVVIYQDLGNLKTDRPLLALNTSSVRKTAVLAGEGLWQWRLEEYNLTDKQEAVDELFEKIMQLISVKDDKRKFRVYPLDNEYDSGQKIALETEIYNDIYEKIYGQNVRLELIDERNKTKSYSYVNAAGSRFELSGLAEGAYRFKATTTLNNKAETVTGQFIVRDLQLESLDLTADFGLLRQLANQTSGLFVTPNQIENLKAYLLKNKAANRLDSTEDLAELIRNKWLFFLLLLLATAEWSIRKWQGNY